MMRSNIALAVLIILTFLLSSTAGIFHTEPSGSNAVPDNTETYTPGQAVIDTPVEDCTTGIVTTGSRAGARAATISLGTTLNLPVITGNWTQSDWSGGAGQEDWSLDDMYRSAEDLNDNFLDGHLELEKDILIEAWQHINDGPGARQRHSAVYNPVGRQVLVYGGQSGWGGARNTTFAYNTLSGAWSERAAYHPGRVGHSAVWDTTNNVMLVFGGRTTTDFMYDDLLAYNPANNTWYQLNSSGPSGRAYHSAIFDSYRNEMIVYGGFSGDWRNLHRDVWVYNLTNDNWTQKANFTRRALAGSVFYPRDGLMYVYGGSSRWTQSEGHTIIPSVSVYNPETDTWYNNSDSEERVDPLMFYDNLNERILVYGGEKGEPQNDTRFYYPETDEWETTIDGPYARYYGAGAWDTVNHELLYYGGTRHQTTYNETWRYSLSTPAYGADGSLVSSTYDAGTTVILDKLSFTTNELAPEVGAKPVKIQIAVAATKPSPLEPMGPDGTGGTYFTNAAGTTIPSSLTGSRYIRYYVNLSTADMLFTPQLRSIRIDYHSYKASDTYDSAVLKPALPIHRVDWDATLPAGTDAKFYMRYGASATDILDNAWEELANGQYDFSYAAMAYFQYRVVISTTDPIRTPVVNSLVFTLNQAPLAPTALFPGNGSHVGTSMPELTWEFSDPDGTGTDKQDAYSLQLSFRKEFDFLNYESQVITTNISSCKINVDLSDGWYYWRVRTMDNYRTWGPWSAVYGLYIDTTPPAAPAVKSITHPFDGTWYSLDTAIFDWDAASDESGIAGYSYTINTSSYDEPPESIMLTANDLTLKKSEAIFKGLVRFSDLADGEWYFQLRASDTLGNWGTASKYKLKVDAAAPTVEDRSGSEATTGEAFKFKFELEDAHSGLTSAELSWRYEGELEYRSEFVTLTTEDNIEFEYTMGDMDVDYIEYYLEVTDSAEPANVYRHPGGGTATIPLHDNDPPVIINATGNFKQQLTKGMTIFMKARDNIDVESAEIFLAGEVSGRPMREVTNDAFEFTMGVDGLAELFQGGAVPEVSYFLMAGDGSNNSARMPPAGSYTITLTKADSDGGADGGDNGKGELSGLSYPVAASIIAAIVVVMLLLMFMMLKKQKEQIEEEQAKLRMQLLSPEGVPEPGAPGTMPPGTTPGTELAGMAGIQPAQPPQQFPEQVMPPGLPPGDEVPGEAPGDTETQDDLYADDQVVAEEPAEEELESKLPEKEE